MGKTPRERLTQLPMPTRSTEASSECFGRVVLTYLREDEQKPASFFILGDALHRSIEAAILQDLDFEDAWAVCVDILAEEVQYAYSLGREVIESTQRGMDTLLDDAEHMLKNWYTQVHPDSDKRHPVYDDYQWPPRTEVGFKLGKTVAGTRYPVWGSADVLLTAKPNRSVPTHRITDWKSGVKRPDNDFQLQFYRFGLDLPDAAANFHMLDRVRKPSIVIEAEPYAGDAFVRAEISKVERMKEAVLVGSVPKFTPDWYCDYCPVQHLCPADGDMRDRKRNGKEFKKLLKNVEPMMEIPDVPVL